MRHMDILIGNFNKFPKIPDFWGFFGLFQDQININIYYFLIGTKLIQDYDLT